MSRCFTYPPTGYALSSARKEALIESTKLQNEKAKSEELRRNEKKRGKKEKREENKEKKNLIHTNIVHGNIGEKFWPDKSVESFHKGSKAESEQLERSSLTEEHEKPVFLCVPSSSSESTENSNKRKRNSSHLDASSCRGNIIRIRLPSRKQNQSDASPNEQQLCFMSGRTHFPSQKKDDIAFGVGSDGCTSELASCGARQCLVWTDREQMSSTLKQVERLDVGKALNSPVTDAVMTPMLKEELLYKNLMWNWVPPLLQDACPDAEDQDWFFQCKNEGVKPEKRRICRNDSMCSSTTSLWPCAQYLPEVYAHALPFTVPF